jgi:hypothetical protein
MRADERVHVPGLRCELDGQRLPVVDVSAIGLFVATIQPPLPGQVVALVLHHPATPPVRLSARVTWVNGQSQPRKATQTFGFGAKIVTIGLAEKLALLELLRSHVRPRGPSPA